HPQAVPDEVPGRGVNIVEKEDTVVKKPTKSKAKAKAATKVKEATSVEVKTEAKQPDEELLTGDWVEDADGNFVQKGD
ncbi:uncharacterized protein METZ01_LOCUS194731, partial [marine metagenome]